MAHGVFSERLELRPNGYSPHRGSLHFHFGLPSYLLYPYHIIPITLALVLVWGLKVYPTSQELEIEEIGRHKYFFANPFLVTH
jgi:hypothetical protein